MTAARRSHAVGVEARFDLFRSVLFDDAVAATRAHRRQEVHRGRPACQAAALCGDCRTDVWLCIREVQYLYDRAIAHGRATSLTATLSPLIEAVEESRPVPGISRALLRTLLANAGKSARRKLAGGPGSPSARPERALLRGVAFAALRNRPELLQVVLLVVRFATSNTRLPSGVLPYGQLAEELQLESEQVRRRVDEGLALARACDAAWMQAHVDGPLSQRLTESWIDSEAAFERMPTPVESTDEEWVLAEADEVLRLAQRRHRRGWAAPRALLGAITHVFGPSTAEAVAASAYFDAILPRVHGERQRCCVATGG